MMEPRRSIDVSSRGPARVRDAGRRVREPQRMSTDARLRRPSSLARNLMVGRLLRGLGLLGVSALAALGVLQVAAWVERSESFGRALPIRTVAVHGVEGPRVDEVLAYAAVTVGAPLFSVDVEAVAARVLEHPFIAQARVRRLAPDGIEITVTSREARAVLSAGTGLYLVDGAGHVMKSARAGDGLDLPVLTGVASEGDELAAAVSLVIAHEAAGSPGGPLAEVHGVAGIGFELVLSDGARVRIGKDNLSDKLVRLTQVLRHLHAAGRQASQIDIDDDRRPERAVVRLRTEAEMQPAGGMNIPRERG